MTLFAKLKSLLKPAPLGVRGERHAARYLRQRGMKIIAKNRRYKGGEIDLIALDKDNVVFVEVRTRNSASFMSPESSIRRDKRRALLRTVRRLVQKYPIENKPPRVDVVAIIWPKGAKKPAQTTHYKNALPLGTW